MGKSVRSGENLRYWCQPKGHIRYSKCVHRGGGNKKIMGNRLCWAKIFYWWKTINLPPSHLNLHSPLVSPSMYFLKMFSFLLWKGQHSGLRSFLTIWKLFAGKSLELRLRIHMQTNNSVFTFICCDGCSRPTKYYNVLIALIRGTLKESLFCCDSKRENILIIKAYAQTEGNEKGNIKK